MNPKKLLKKVAPAFLLDYYHYLMPLVGAIIYRFPSKKLIVIGVTGTSGKSTTVDFITRILEEGGNKVASISSIRFKIGPKEWQNKLKMTTPGRLTIQKFLRQAVNAGCKYAVLEIASEGIKQHRHKFINFDAAVFTGLSEEHLDAHGGFENYRAAKLKLFAITKNVHVINGDDENAKYFLDIAPFAQGFGGPRPATKKITFGTGENVDVKADHIISKDGKLTFDISGTSFSLGLLGKFNTTNALAAIAVGMYYGVSVETASRALEKVKGMPGRLEVVSQKPLVVIDYAFTPDQLEKSYQSVKNFFPPSDGTPPTAVAGRNLVCVLGACGGGRDKWKRPVLGKLAQQYCKEIIITNEDPYDEDPLEIMEQVAGGIDPDVKPSHYRIVLDRKDAIEGAVGLLKKDDVLIITGKGAEPLMCLADGKKIPWSDKKIVEDALKV